MVRSITRAALALALSTTIGCATAGTNASKVCNVADLVQLKGDRIEVGESIYFETGSAKIDACSTDLLDAVAQILNNTPTIGRLTIEGYTDSVGDPDFNKNLSQERADAVKRYVAGKGVAESRLASMGYGMELPIASNDTEAGRAQNRRVEFKVTR